MKRPPPTEARRWFVSGRVQGVGFRWFVQKNAAQLGVRGWTRNEDDGRVQVYGVGTPDQLDRLAGLIHQGPRLSDVRSVEQLEALVEKLDSFEIR
ncbi:MAG TPA: acylphosphatase [Bryobacteraceae bacterium]|nr:acylphosphatase [Bryobacteraceae bacterium]